jgi:hypothetical protein
MALAILVVCAPSTTAARVHPAGTFTTPFGGVTDDMGSAAMAGCGVSSLVSPPVFNLTTGIGKGIVSSADSTCPTNLNGNLGSASEQIGLASTNFTTTSALHHLTAKWSVHWTFAITTSSPTGRGNTEAIGDVSVSLLVFDSTNFTVVNQTSWFVQHIDFGNQTTSSSGGANHTLAMGAHLVAGHVYYIYVYVYISSYTTVVSSPGGTATAKVDLGSGKNKATLHSYSFT